jgi:hypothetical protein
VQPHAAGGGGCHRLCRAKSLTHAAPPLLPAPACAQNFNPFGVNTRSFRYWEEDELRDLCSSVGLQGFTRNRSRMYIMFSAIKPEQQPPQQW